MTELCFMMEASKSAAQPWQNPMDPLSLVKLRALMERTSGSRKVKIGLIDGPLATDHPDLADKFPQKIAENSSATCTKTNSAACLHGTFIAGILSAQRDSPAPAICPSCSLHVRPIFAESSTGREHMPSATPKELATAIIECIDAGAWVINLSLALEQPSTKWEQLLEEALNQALKRGVIVVAAAGNQGTLGSSAITRHPWVIPVVSCDLRGRPMNESNLSGSIAKRGLSAPGDGITSLGAEGKSLTLGGTSVAVPFVTGAIALLWSEFPAASAAQIKFAITQAFRPRRATLIPPLLNAAVAYQHLFASECEGAESMTKVCDDNTVPAQSVSKSYRVRLPGFISDEEIGLGDVIKRTTAYFGIKPCGGCKHRTASLNRWVVFTR